MMRPRFRRYVRNSFLALAFLSFAGWWVPSFFSAERYRRRLEAALERSMKRPVAFGAVSFRLLPRPGFSIENAVIREDPAFGSEPFARVDRIECDLHWRSLWLSRLDFARLHLDHPSFNFVRNARGEWNVERLLLNRILASPGNPVASGGVDNLVGSLNLEADEARINFKVGANKKPFALTDLRARLKLDPGLHRVEYRLSARPIRTDFSLPTPGVLELAGDWTPGKDLQGPLRATLRSDGALLYNWVPLLTGHNPEIYGVLDTEIHFAGSIRMLKMEGEIRLSQLHRWESLPPSDPMPCTLHFRGELDRARGRMVLDSLDASFADSHLHLTGAVDKLSASPELDLVVALERSRLEDLLALGQRLWGGAGGVGVSGRVDGLLAIQGPWSERRYGGFVGARDMVLRTTSGTFPVSEVALRIDRRGAHLAPVKITLAPRVELMAEGAITRAGAHTSGVAAASKPAPLRYELTLSAKAVSLRDLVRFGRAVGLEAVQNLAAQGLATATFRLAGSAWPLARPALSGRVDMRGARLLVPGLTEPLNIPRARLQVNGDQVVADPVLAVIGTTLFTGRLEHRGERKEPWKFEVRANGLTLEQAALWFHAPGNQRQLPLLERLPVLSSFGARRTAAVNLFSVVNAQGNFAVPTVTYRGLTLTDFRASLEISGRVIRVAGATFRAGGGRGQGRGQVDLNYSAARMTADLTLAGVNLQALARRLPPALEKVRGSVSGAGHFETRGLTREEMSANLHGQARVNLKNIFLGDFDPLDAVARQSRWGALEPVHGEVGIRSGVVTLEFRDRQVVLRSDPLELTGAKLRLIGTYGFDGAARLDVHADLHRITRRWSYSLGESDSSRRQGDLHLAGPLGAMEVVPEMQVVRVRP